MRGEDLRELKDGTITSVVAQKRDPSRVSVFIDGDFAFGLTAETAVSLGLRRGIRLSRSEQEHMLESDTRVAARVTALAFLARRPRTIAEVRDKLKGTGFTEIAIEAAISRLSESGYLDDRAYAQEYVRTRLARGYGPRRVRQELRTRGVADPIVEGAIAGTHEETSVHEQALRTGMNRARRLLGEKDIRKRKKKLYDFLVRRGYDPDTAWSVIRHVQETEWR